MMKKIEKTIFKTLLSMYYKMPPKPFKKVKKEKKLKMKQKFPDKKKMSKYGDNKNKDKYDKYKRKKSTISLNMVIYQEDEKYITHLFKKINKLFKYVVITLFDKEKEELLKSEMNKHKLKGEIILYEEGMEYRQISLEKTIGKTDYVFFLDSNERFWFHNMNYFKKLNKDCYCILHKEPDVEMFLTRIVSIKSSNVMGWVWLENERLDAIPVDIFIENMRDDNYTVPR